MLDTFFCVLVGMCPFTCRTWSEPTSCLASSPSCTHSCGICTSNGKGRRKKNSILVFLTSPSPPLSTLVRESITHLTNMAARGGDWLYHIFFLVLVYLTFGQMGILHTCICRWKKWEYRSGNPQKKKKGSNKIIFLRVLSSGHNKN